MDNQHLERKVEEQGIKIAQLETHLPLLSDKVNDVSVMVTTQGHQLSKIEGMVSTLAANHATYATKSDVRPIADKANNAISKDDFDPIKRLVYGAVKVTLTAVGVAVLGLVIYERTT